MPNYWKPGDQVVLREIWRGKVWSGRPCTVVEDTPSRLVLYSGAGVRWMKPSDPAGVRLRIPEDEWALREDVWTLEVLRIVTPGARHSVLLLWSAGFQEFLLWYVNLEDPLVRTDVGFDYKDRLLDIEIAPDLSRWKWKDEDELEEAVARGIVTSQQSGEIRAEGERVIAALDVRRPPFNEAWDRWRPDPDWPSPGFPDGWDDLGRYPAVGGQL